MKTRISTALTMLIAFSPSAFAQLRFSDGSEQSKAAITFERIQVLHGDGSATQNGTDLLDALAAQATEQTVDLILLEPGFYNVGTQPVNLVEFVNVQGLARDKTMIQGNGSVVMNGAEFVTVSGLTIESSSNGSTAVVLDGVRTRFENVRLNINVSSGSNIGFSVINGGSLELSNSEMGYFGTATGGSLTGLRVTGEADLGGGEFEGSQANLFFCDISLSDDGSSMVLRGVDLGDGTATNSEDGVEVEIESSIVEVEGGSSATALRIASDGGAFVVNSEVGLEEGVGSAVSNNGLMNAINTLFLGTRSGAGVSVYANCATETNAGATPITDTNSAVP